MKPNKHINRKVAASILKAFDFTENQGNPFNVYLVIQLNERTGRSGVRIFNSIAHKFRDWLNNKRAKGECKTSPMYVYTFEAPEGKNIHVNWVIYIPPSLKKEFLQKVEAWVEKSQGEIIPNTLHSQDVDPKRYKSLAKYIIKGIDPLYVDHFYLQKVYDGPQGTIYGKRAGVSQSLGPTARKKSGFIIPKGRKFKYQS